MNGANLLGHYDSRLVILSVVIAVMASYSALDLGGHVTASRGRLRFLWLGGGALVIGGAIPVMHYTGMAAVTMSAMTETHGDVRHMVDVSTLGMISIIFITFLLLGLAIFTSLVDRRFSSPSLELEAQEKRYNQILQMSFDAFVDMEPDGMITDWSKQAEHIFGCSAHAAVGQKFSELILPARHEQEFLEACRQLALLGNDQEARRRCELQASCFDRRKIAIELTTSSIKIGAKRTWRRLYARPRKQSVRRNS
jgi:PAS domain S-box-containing protein